MEIIRDNVDKLIDKTDYEYKNEFSDKKVNTFFNYWLFFDQKESEIVKMLGIPLDVVVYSKWYWSERYRVSYEELYNEEIPGDLEDYIFKFTLENIEHKLEDPDWYGMESIYNEIHNSECNCINCKENNGKQ